MEAVKRRVLGDRGSTLFLVALLMPVLLFFLAIATDLALGHVERRRVQNAADAGALAAMQVFARGGTDAQIWAVVRDYTTMQNEAQTFEACYITVPGGACSGTVGSGSIPNDVTGVRVTAHGTIPTFFGGLTGYHSFTSPATGAGGLGLMDIVLVFDKSGTMDDDSCYIGNNIMLQQYPQAQDGSCNSALCTNGNSGCQLHPLEQGSCQATYLPESGSNCSYSSGRTYGVWLPDFLAPPDRVSQPISDAKEAASAFVDMNNRNLAKLALVAFSNNPASLSQSLTSDFTRVTNAIAGLSAGGDTATPSGLQVARTELGDPTRSRAEAMKVIVLLTDGQPNAPYCSGSVDHCPAAQNATRAQATAARDEGITIYAIGLGVRADQQLMADVAAITDGKSYYAPTSDQLDEIYRDIFGQILQHLVE